MKKALLLVSILFLSVVSTACINNLAVQELNTKAKHYMDQGDYQAAIARLKSSIDLDDTIFETHYNLAVAYTQAEEYENAIKSYIKALEINSDAAEVYYSLAIAQSNFALDLATGALRIDENGEVYSPTKEQIDEESGEYKPNKQALKMIEELNSDAIRNLNIYLTKAPNSSDYKEVEEKIKEIQDNQ